ncbi:MAG: SRPBCC domain-containing protein [Rhodothermia bacterium]|nr:SRPBCC domain-containing protein [Rhodothermia bacterium]
MKTIIHFFRIHAAPEEVFQALTTSEGLAGWWSRDVRAERGVGGLVRFRFLEGFNPVMEVTAEEKDRMLGWKCVDGHDKWRDNTFSFGIRPADDEADLMFVQEYAKELSDEDYGTYNFNWGFYLGSLKKLCETGEGTPFEPGQ